MLHPVLRYLRTSVPIGFLWVAPFAMPQLWAGQEEAFAQQASPVNTQLAQESARAVVPGEQNSVGGSQKIESNLGTVSREVLLKKGRSLRSRGGAAAVEANSELIQQAKKTERAVSFGVSRSESLADGAVAAPGIADFAEFFRSSHQQAAAAEKGGSSQVVDSGPLGGKGDEYLKRQAEAEKLRIQTVESIKKILKSRPPKDQRLNLLLRLAELQVERHSYLLELEIQTFNRGHDEWIKTRKGPEPEFNTDQSRAQLLAGISALRTASKEFPAHQRTPEILFNLGFLLNQLESDSARLYFEQLVKKFPNSEFVPDAYLSLGEFFFQKNQFNEALKMYQAVLKHKGTDAYNYAVYKLGWTYFNLPGKNQGEHEQNLKKSLAAFQLVVKLSDAPDASVILKGLRKEALKDMILVFVDLKDIAAAQRFYASLGEQELYFTFLERLAWQTTEAGEFDAAIGIYRKLIQEAPTHKRLPVLLSKVAEIHDKRNDPASVLSTLRFMSKSLAKDSPWMAAHEDDKAILQERNETLSKTLRYWSKHLHAQAQKTKRPEYYQHALAAYQIHIENFDDTPEVYDSSFYAGEIFVFQKKYEKAAGMYARAVQVDEKFKLNNPLTRDAVLNAIASLDLAIDQKPAPKLPEPGKAKSKLPLPALHGKLVWSLDAFERNFPEDPETTKLTHRAARILYAFGDYASSLERWKTLTKRAPRSSEAAEGIRMSLRVAINREDWEQAREIGGHFLKMKDVEESYVARDIVSVMKVALFQLALQREREKNTVEAEKLFVSYQKQYPEDADAPKALYNAANNAFKNGRMDPAITHLKTLLSMYQKSPLIPDSLYLIATSFDGLGLFAEGVVFYEQLFSGHQKHKLAQDAALRAIELRAALQQYPAVERQAVAFLKLWSGAKEAPAVWRLLGESYDERSQYKRSLDTYSRAARAFAGKRNPWAVYFCAKAAVANELAGEMADRNKMITIGLKTYEKLSPEERGQGASIDGVRLIARLKVEDVEAAFQKVMKLRVTDGLKLTDQFTAIRAEVEKVASRYVDIVKLGNAEAGIQSLYRVAQMQGYLAKVLLNSPVPKGATPVEVEQFKGTLERIAIPLQEESLNLYLTAWQRAKETEAITPFTGKIYQKLVELRPAEFKELDGTMPQASYLAMKLRYNDKTSEIFED